MHSLPVFVRLGGRPVMLIGTGEAAAAKRRLLERAGATIVGEEDAAALAIIALDDPDATVARLRSRGVLVNAVDRPDLCDFTLPAIIDRSPVIVAIGTGGASAGLAAALRQRLEAMLPAGLGGLAEILHAARARLRARFPDGGDRRRALGAALAAGGPIDPLGADASSRVAAWLGDERSGPSTDRPALTVITLSSPDPDDLTMRQARALAHADRVVHDAGVPSAILDRGRADATRMVSSGPPVGYGEDVTVYLEMKR
ncbi:NAD(P)-dependent oxidoreductase [uncultured Sphingomonas sp.]|uniref:precorrin-2 dehydrogenase/sirohydrochlorin ferrochelatase family protein n=1 Tax=uncultured Sphingomonas sp. TaxID=158754 RepID=UPI0035C95F40